MSRVLMLVPVVMGVLACGKTETPPADTMANATEMSHNITDADVTGTWKGTNMPVGSDSVIGHWTQVCGAGSCKGGEDGSNVVVLSTYTLSGDSAVGVSQPFSDPSIKGGEIIDTWVVHLNGDNATGTGAMKLASKPDSVVMSYHFAGSRVR